MLSLYCTAPRFAQPAAVRNMRYVAFCGACRRQFFFSLISASVVLNGFFFDACIYSYEVFEKSHCLPIAAIQFIVPVGYDTIRFAIPSFKVNSQAYHFNSRSWHISTISDKYEAQKHLFQLISRQNLKHLEDQMWWGLAITVRKSARIRRTWKVRIDFLWALCYKRV